MEINGVAHIQLTVNDLECAIPFYETVLGLMGLKPVVKALDGLYMIGGRTGVLISQSSPEHRSAMFEQRRIGLHHLCFRARSREDIDELYAGLKRLDVRVVREPSEGPWAEGYYSLLFEDPEGIRLEVNFVPGRGHFEDPSKLPLREFPGSRGNAGSGGATR